MLLGRPNLQQISTLTHEGKVLIVATVVESGNVRLIYTVKQDGFEDSALQNPNGSGWEAFKTLELPSDGVGDPSVAAKERDELTDTQGRYLLRSIYSSADLTANAPVQLVSHDGHLYIFRQSTRGTLLVDRFVLDGMTNTLTPKLEVRYKRSRQRYAPLKSMKITSGGQIESVDSLDFRDMRNQPFTEPTSELCPDLLNGLYDGWFSVLITPTNEQDVYRWHIFAFNRASRKVDLLTLRAGDERVFDLQDYWFRTIDPITEQVQYDSIPGLIRRELELQDAGGRPLTIGNGLAAAKYDLQHEQQTQNGPQLVRDASKVLLAVPTDAGTATLSFAIGADGRLAQIAGDSKDELLRSQERETLLPLNLLDNIRAIGDSTAAPSGVIAGMSRSDDEDSADRVRVQVSKDDKAAVARLKGGDTVKLSNTASYNGLYRVAKADDGSFIIDAPFKYGEIGDWEKIEEQESGLVFDGMLTGYEKTRDGKLKVFATSHGLAAGDLVQIVGDGDYSGEYPVLKHDETSFTIQRLWDTGEAVNIKLESRKRRGLVLDGKRDWIAAPFSQSINLSAGFTVEAWVRLGSDADQTILATQPEFEADPKLAGLPAAAAAAALAVKDGKFTVAITRPLLGRTSALRVASETPAPLREWVHLACSFDGQALHLLENGAITASVTIDELNKKAKVAQDAAVKQLEQDVAEQRAPAAALDALRDRLKQIPPSFSLRVGGLSLAAAPQLKGGQVEPGDFLQGQLADVRVWTIGRCDKAINDAMHLQLTGRETGLAGYWRLGGIAIEDDGGQRVFDFSADANHGVVYGAPYAGGITLGRTLRDGKTAAVKFGNADLVAVREGAIYVESFEFRADKPVDPANADGKQARIFTPSLWGRLSRMSEERQAFAPTQPNFQFEQLSDGWWRAACRFLVPEGVRLLRCFELAGVAGDWSTLELRRYAIRLVSDTVTLSSAQETAKLPALAQPLTILTLDQLAKLEARQKELAAQQAPLAARQKELSALLDTFKRAPQIRQELDALLPRLQAEQRELEQQAERERNNPLNYWCKIVLKRTLDSEQRTLGLKVYNNSPNENANIVLVDAQETSDGNGLWRFEPDGPYYKMIARNSGKGLKVFNNDGGDGASIQQFNVTLVGDGNGQWTVNDLGGSYSFQSASTGKCIAASNLWSEAQIVQYSREDAEGGRGRWLLQTVGEPCAPSVGRANDALAAKASEFAAAQQRQKDLQRAVDEGATKQADWEKELASLQAQLTPIDQELAEVAKQLTQPSADPAEQLAELAAKEREEAPLITRRKELERLLADISNRNETERRRNEWRNRVQELTWARDARQREYDTAVAHPPTGELKTDLWGDRDGSDYIHIDWHIHTAPILAPAGKQVRGVQFYNHNARFAVKIRCAYADGSGEEWITDENTNGNAAEHQDWVDTAPVACPHGKVVTGVQLYKKGNRSAIKIRCDYPWGGGEEWVANTDDQSSYFRSRRSEQNDFIDLHPVTLSATQVLSGIQILKYGNRMAPLLPYYDTEASDRARNVLNATIYELSAAQAELDRLNQALNAGDSQREACEKELKEIIARLAPIQQRIAVLSTAYLSTIAKANSTAQAMPDLPDVDDPRGLKIQGALLPFAKAASRPHLMESCAGRVTLTYQDGDGNLRQTHYDTAYDADGKGEEWLLDGYRAALALGGGSPALALPGGLLGELGSQVTIEFWAKGGGDLPKANALLSALDGGGRRLSIQLPNAQGEVVWEAGQAPAGGAIDSLVKGANARLYRGRWTHWAFVKNADAGELRIYVDGKLWAKNDPKAKDGGGVRTQSLSGISQAALGSLPGQSGGWQGQLCELRIWNVALGEREIEANSVLTLSGNEPGLLAYYPLSEASGDTARDHTGRGNHFTIGGNAWAPCTAPIGRIEPAPIVLLGQPTSFNGQDAFVRLPTLDPDFSTGLTIEARVRYEAFRGWSRIVDLGNGENKHNILLANRAESRNLVLQIYLQDGRRVELECRSELPQRQWVHVAATIQPDGAARIYIDGEERASGKLELPPSLPRSSNYVGKSNWGDPLFEGQLDYVRLYTYAVSADVLKQRARTKTPAAPITLLGQAKRFNGQTDFVQLPVLEPDFRAGFSVDARVRFERFNSWSRIIDIGNGDAKWNILLANRENSRRLIFQIYRDDLTKFTLESPADLPQDEWLHVAATVERDGFARLYINGAEVACGQMQLPATLRRTSNYIGKSNWPDQLFQGQIEQVRLYTYTLSSLEVQELLPGRIWTTPIHAEYSRVKVDAQKRKSVMMMRCLALPTPEGVRLIDEQRIEELEMTWVGNAQIKPTLIGYIEGAPPIPSENLTEEQDYNGATSVELIQSSDVEYSWTREEESSRGLEAEFLLGVKSESSAGIGVMTSVEEIKSGAGAKASYAYHRQNASTVGASHSLMSSDRLELRGSQEPEPHFPQLGQRFIPKNIGYALVTSGLADVFVSKLKRSGRMIGYQVLPVEGVPMDVNTITFMINPAYTMAGSLDGLTGSRATSDRFFQHVPEMRSQYGSLYPASYFRLKEAYSLKNQIDQQDKIHESYFNQFDASFVDEGSVDHQMYRKREDKQPVEVDGSGDAEPTDELGQKIEAKKQELADLKKANPVDKAAVDAKQREIDDLESERKSNAQGQRKQAGEERQSQINSTHSDLSTRANASDGLALWQRKLETLQLRAGKRNIVNTYVWDGDGGFHAEEQQFASTVEHSVGGSLDMSLAIGGQMSYAFTKVLVELNAYVGVSMTQTMSKTESTSKGLELHVDLSGVESRGITDYRDYPILPGEKVDRYRFMSFFLENNTNHWHDFFNYVVDPEWLASNDEEARALRQAQGALPNKVWRVLHRVTYVERPALMGFGRAALRRDEAADDIRALRDQVTELQGKVATLQKEINDKLDMLLSRKP